MTEAISMVADGRMSSSNSLTSQSSVVGFPLLTPGKSEVMTGLMVAHWAD